jgi:hypothetical protein
MPISAFSKRPLDKLFDARAVEAGFKVITPEVVLEEAEEAMFACVVLIWLLALCRAGRGRSSSYCSKRSCAN